MPKLLAGQGGEGLYVPFLATVSLQAAALGAEMVSSWVNTMTRRLCARESSIASSRTQRRTAAF